METTPPTGLQIIREHELITILKVHRTTVERWENAGDFPRRFKLGPRAVGWLWSDVEKWLAERRAAGAED